MRYVEVLGSTIRVGMACVRTSLIFWHSNDINLISVVFRAGYKLEAAIEHFKCDVAEKVALDAGLSTGGFTDCLLQSGAACVYGVDVGYGQVSSSVSNFVSVVYKELVKAMHLQFISRFDHQSA